MTAAGRVGLSPRVSRGDLVVDSAKDVVLDVDMLKKAPRPCMFQRCAGAVRSHPWFTVYVTTSLVLAILLLVDPMFNRPSGLITSSLFTGRPSSHGPAKPCAFDYEGSWQIGLVMGSSPLDIRVSPEAAITCATLGNRTAASYVAEPSLVVPMHGEALNKGARMPWTAPRIERGIAGTARLEKQQQHQRTRQGAPSRRCRPPLAPPGRETGRCTQMHSHAPESPPPDCREALTPTGLCAQAALTGALGPLQCVAALLARRAHTPGRPSPCG